MADEQDWAAYTNITQLDGTETLLARQSSGGGVEFATGLVPYFKGSYYLAGGPIQCGVDGAIGTVITHGLTTLPVADVKCYVGAVSAAVAGLVNGSLILVPRTSSACTTSIFASNGQIALHVDSVGVVRPGVDNSRSLGAAAYRWSTVYAATGTINTSDQREKTWRGGLSEDEYAAALEIIDELGFFQWNDSIAEKGPEDARYHFGVRAQQAFDILDEHLGVDAWRSYAFACHDSWPEERDENDVITQEAGDRYGLREGQFTMFLLAAQARRQKELEQRIEALEA